MHGYNISMDMQNEDAPTIHVSFAPISGGRGQSEGRNRGGEMLVGTLLGKTSTGQYAQNVRGVAAHEFGHVLQLDHATNPNNVMSALYAGGTYVTKAQLEEAIEKCRTDKVDENDEDGESEEK
jgi:hypothetical protein